MRFEYSPAHYALLLLVTLFVNMVKLWCHSVWKVDWLNLDAYQIVWMLVSVVLCSWIQNLTFTTLLSEMDAHSFNSIRDTIPSNETVNLKCLYFVYHVNIWMLFYLYVPCNRPIQYVLPKVSWNRLQITYCNTQIRTSEAVRIMDGKWIEYIENEWMHTWPTVLSREAVIKMCPILGVTYCLYPHSHRTDSQLFLTPSQNDIKIACGY